jgi:ADP-ribosyl-[dinitrogen reductase] hydrolase
MDINISNLERVRGGIWGVATGDALGATVEFMDRDEIKAKHGVLREIIGGGWMGLRAGEWTDDTEMTLAVAEGIFEDKEQPIEPIGKRFLEWQAGDPRDIGYTVAASIGAYKISGDWHKGAFAVHELDGQTAGNGSLMRTLPVAFAYKTPEEIYMRAIEISRMTHWDLQAGLCCAYYCICARELLQKEPLAAMEIAWKKVDSLTQGKERRSLRPLMDIDLHQPQKIMDLTEGELLPAGYVIPSFQCALWAFLNHNNFEDTTVAAVNLGGDADTVGAIVGGLAGTYWGIGSIPKRWLGKFDKKQSQRLDLAARGLWKLAATSSNQETNEVEL